MARVVELKSNLAGIEEIDKYTVYSASQNYSGAEGDVFFSGFIGKNFKKNQQARRERKKIRTESKAQARTAKAEAKKGEAVAKQLSAKASEAGVQGDIALASALKSDTPKASTGFPKWGYVAIGVGVLALAGGAYFVFKKK